MRKRKSGRSWIDRQKKDQYVESSRRSGLRSRAAYKLVQINEKYNILSKGMTVLDLGCAPGSWLQIVGQRVGRNGLIVGVDLQDIQAVDGAEFIQGDFENPTIVKQILNVIGDRDLDLVISDMAPNLTGTRITDQAKIMSLVENVWLFSCNRLRVGGSLLLKVFEGDGIESIRSDIEGSFDQVNTIKPAASRKESREVYILGRGHNVDTQSV